MNDWTPEMVEERLVEAAAVLRRLPAERGQGYFSTWPTMFVEFSDLVGQTPEPMRLPPPSPNSIARTPAHPEGVRSGATNAPVPRGPLPSMTRSSAPRNAAATAVSVLRASFASRWMT